MNMHLSLRSQKGQGTVEYLLILMITVVLILTIITQFNRSFAKYATQFFDGYIVCLLDTGELPNSAGNCSGALEDYNPTAGAPHIAGDPIGDWANNQPEPGYADGSAGSAAGGKNGDGKGATDSSSGSSGGNGSGNSGRETVSSSNGSGDGGSAPVGSLRGGRFGARRSTPVGKADAKDKAGAGSADSMLATNAIGSVSGDSYNGSGKKKVMVRGFEYFGQQEKEARAAERPPVAPVAKETEGQDSLKPKKAIEPERKPAAFIEKEETGFSFGYLIKMLLIAGIIVAIVVFFGGQILQASKSWEK